MADLRPAAKAPALQPQDKAPSAPVLREMRHKRTERARDITDKAEIARLLQTPVHKDFAFMSHHKQLKIRQAAKTETEIAATDLRARSQQEPRGQGRAGLSWRSPQFFFEGQPPGTANRQPPTATNRQPPPTANRHPLK